MLSIITTSTDNTKLERMALALRFNAAKQPKCPIEWIVVSAEAKPPALFTLTENRFPIVHIAKSPDSTAQALTEALTQVSFDYVVYLQEDSITCNLWLESLWLTVAAGIAAFKCNVLAKSVMVTRLGEIKHGGGPLTRRAASPSSISPACYGAPLRSFLEVDGYDTAYDETGDQVHTDICNRMARLGLPFEACDQTWVITTKSSPTASKENRKQFNLMMKERSRITPSTENNISGKRELQKN